MKRFHSLLHFQILKVYLLSAVEKSVRIKAAVQRGTWRFKCTGNICATGFDQNVFFELIVKLKLYSLIGVFAQRLCLYMVIDLAVYSRISCNF